MATEAVLKFLSDHNRPYSANDVGQSLNEFGKTAVQKALDALVSKDKVVEKVYGKQKVYFVKQQSDIPVAQVKEDLMQMDRTILDLSLQIKEVNDKLKVCDHQLSGSTRKISLEEAEDQRDGLIRQYEDLQMKLEEYKDIDVVCPKEKAQAEALYNKTLNEFKKRKRMCMDVLNSILENYPKTKKHLYEEIGLETDEDVHFSLDKM